MSQQTIAFIGAGNMASALITGLIADGTAPGQIIASDADSTRREALAASTGIQTRENNHDAARDADVIVLAVKPQVLPAVCTELAATVAQNPALVISIAAGVRTDDLRIWLGNDVAIVRAIPNTPALVQTGATGLYAGPEASAAQRDSAERILRSVGLVLWLADEASLDAVTAVSGSGPAYFFLVMEAIEEAARELGLDSDTAHLLTLQTALGAARMAMESSDDPKTLRQKVTSPGGTTEAALGVLENGGLRACFQDALKAAADRSVELSKMVGKD